VRVQVVIETDDEGPPVVHEVAHMERGDLHIDTLGLQLAEAKDFLQKVQKAVIDEQIRTCLAEQVACPECGRRRRHKDTDMIVVRTLFSTLHLRSPRWCPCQPQPTRTFSPLAALLSERTTPELLYLGGARARDGKPSEAFAASNDCPFCACAVAKRCLGGAQAVLGGRHLGLSRYDRLLVLVVRAWLADRQRKLRDSAVRARARSRC
jgi:hypothetical protein